MNKKEYSRVGRDKDKGFRADLKIKFYCTVEQEMASLITSMPPSPLK